MSRKVIGRKQLPTKLPLGTTLVLPLVLDHYKAPEWVWGIAIAFLVILWVAAIALLCTEEEKKVDLH